MLQLQRMPSKMYNLPFADLKQVTLDFSTSTILKALGEPKTVKVPFFGTISRYIFKHQDEYATLEYMDSKWILTYTGETIKTELINGIHSIQATEV